MDSLTQQFRTPEIYGDIWFNSDPIPITALRGQVVMLHFWDYTSQACMNTLPYIKEWNKRYAEKNFVMIGIHTPEFPFASDPFEVRKAIEKYRISYPVVLDNDYRIWNSFKCKQWPSCFIIDKHGYIRTVQEGAGSYKDIERTIQALITETGYRAELPELMQPVRLEDRQGVISHKTTPDIHAGFQYRSIGNVEGFVAHCTTSFEDPEIYLEGRLYLKGNWYADREFLRFDDNSGDEGAAIFLYRAKEVNVVMKPEGEKSFQVFIQQDNKFLSTTNKGEDVLIDAEGRSFVLVNEPKLYKLVNNEEFGGHKMQLSSRSNGFALYSISFVTSVLTELISQN